LAGWSAPPCAAQGEGLADYLYRVGREHRQAGKVDDAIHELQKALLIDPGHEAARRELHELQSLEVEREQAMDEALGRVERSGVGAAQPPAVPGTRAETPAAKPSVGPTASSRPAFRPAGLFRAKGVRAPNPRVNKVKWIYVFGRDGDTDYGALHQPQSVVVSLPASVKAPVTIRIIDADVRGRHDEADGAWTTSTAFSVFAGSTRLASRTVTPQDRDGTVLSFGPFTAAQGEPQGESVLFRVEAAGLEGNDNNLFAVEVDSPRAEVLSFNPSIRMAKQEGKRMTFFPEVPAGTSRLVEENYDLDPDGGSIRLIPRARDGRQGKGIKINPSGSGEWSRTDVTVPAGTDGTRWTYQITKATQRKGNMGFRLTDDRGRPLPIYFGDGQARPQGEGAPAPVHLAGAPAACNTFEFDASESYDPDQEALTYRWDFGDGTTAEGARARHIYAEAGDYRVTLTVVDPSGTACCQDTEEQTVHVNLPPTAVLTGPEASCAGSAASFSAEGSTDSAAETLAYRWDFGDGTTAEGLDVTHRYEAGGIYDVRLTVDDGRGTACSTAVAAQRVRVNSPPLARANEAAAICTADLAEPLEADFSAAGSTDPDGDRLTYRWDFGDGESGEGAKVSHRYRLGGRYTATLTVDDGSRSSCSTGTATVPVHLNRSPVVRVTPEEVGCPGERLTFDASASTDPDGDALTYRWDFGDGTTGSGEKAEHAYAQPGDYDVEVAADDGSGMSCGVVTAQTAADVNAQPVARIRIQEVQ
jgi:PKD repeat protein